MEDISDEDDIRCPICGYIYYYWPKGKTVIDCTQCKWAINRNELVDEDAQVAWDY